MKLCDKSVAPPMFLGFVVSRTAGTVCSPVRGCSRRSLTGIGVGSATVSDTLIRCALLDDLGSGFGSAVDRPGIAEWGLWDGNRIEGLGV